LNIDQVVSPPSDGISSLSFSSKANYLVASAWDNQVFNLPIKIFIGINVLYLVIIWYSIAHSFKLKIVTEWVFSLLYHMHLTCDIILNS
jgi:hypothetical protein